MKTINLIAGISMLPLVVFPQLKTSITNGNWNSASTWSPSGVPSTTDKIRIYHVVKLNQNFTASDTVFVYNELNFANGKSLTLNPGTMILVNNASYDGRIGTVGNNAGVVGNFTFQKWISRCDGYSMYGSPFNASTDDFNWYYCNQCMPSWSNLYCYNEASPGVQDSGYYSNIGSNLQRGKGFFYWYDNYNGGPNFPRQISLNGSINFNSTFDFSVSYTPSSGGFWNDGFNLLSNPYPGTIDWASGSWSKTNVNNAIYTWNSCTGSYAAYVYGIGINGGSRYIPSMQGFWVQANNNNPSLTVDAGAMVNNSQSLLRTTNSDSVDHVLRLRLGDDEIAIHLDPLATAGFDSTMDALKFFSPASRLCSTNNLWTSYDYAINSVKDCNQVIPVKVKGGGTLTITGLSSFNNEYTISLKDLSTNDFTQISDNMPYTFSDTTQVTFQKRFQLHFTKNVKVGIQQNQLDQVEIVKSNGVIQISNPDPSITNIRMYDLQGRLLYSGNFMQQTNLPDPETPVLLWIYNEKGGVTKKIF